MKERIASIKNKEYSPLEKTIENLEKGEIKYESLSKSELSKIFDYYLINNPQKIYKLQKFTFVEYNQNRIDTILETGNIKLINYCGKYFHKINLNQAKQLIKYDLTNVLSRNNIDDIDNENKLALIEEVLESDINKSIELLANINDEQFVKKIVDQLVQKKYAKKIVQEFWLYNKSLILSDWFINLCLNSDQAHALLKKVNKVDKKYRTEILYKSIQEGFTENVFNRISEFPKNETKALISLAIEQGNESILIEHIDKLDAEYIVSMIIANGDLENISLGKVSEKKLEQKYQLQIVQAILSRNDIHLIQKNLKLFSHFKINLSKDIAIRLVQNGFIDDLFDYDKLFLDFKINSFKKELLRTLSVQDLKNNLYRFSEQFDFDDFLYCEQQLGLDFLLTTTNVNFVFYSSLKRKIFNYLKNNSEETIFKYISFFQEEDLFLEMLQKRLDEKQDFDFFYDCVKTKYLDFSYNGDWILEYLLSADIEESKKEVILNNLEEKILIKNSQKLSEYLLKTGYVNKIISRPAQFEGFDFDTLIDPSLSLDDKDLLPLIEYFSKDVQTKLARDLINTDITNVEKIGIQILDQDIAEQLLNHSTKLFINLIDTFTELNQDILDTLLDKVSNTRDLYTIFQNAYENNIFQKNTDFSKLFSALSKDPYFFNTLLKIFEEKNNELFFQICLQNIEHIKTALKHTLPSKFLSNLAQFKKIFHTEDVDGDEKLVSIEKIYKKIEGLQTRTARLKYDPWKNEFDKVFVDSIKNNFIEPSNPNDLNLLYEYVKTFGMNYHPEFVLTFMSIARQKFETNKTYPLLNELGLDENVSISRFKQKITAVIPQIKSSIIYDDLDLINSDGIIFDFFISKMRSSSWSRETTNKHLLELTRNSKIDNPKLFEMPNGYDIFDIEVKQLKRKKSEDEKDVESVINKLLGSEELMNKISTVKNAFKQAQNLSNWWSNQKQIYSIEINKTIKTLEQKLNNNQINEKMKSGLIKNIESGNKILSEITSIDIDNNLSENELIALMEKIINILGNKKSLTILRVLSAKHMLMTCPQEFKTNILTYSNNETDKVDDEILSFWNNLYKDYIHQHYLSTNQNPLHTYHEKIPKKIRKPLNTIWDNQKKNNKSSIFKTYNQLKTLKKSTKTTSDVTSTITMVPSKGLLRVLSGDLGDACYTSQQIHLAKGEYQNLISYTFVENFDSTQDFRGSVLAIETIDKNTRESVLLIRANNPQNKLLKKYDSDSLIRETLEAMIDLAETRGIDKVVVPLDNTSESSSNREEVSDYYKKHYNNAQKIDLIEEDVTEFNGYNNYDSQGKHPVVVIWENMKKSDDDYYATQEELETGRRPKSSYYSNNSNS